MPFGGPFLETPRHEENTQTCVFLVFWTPGVPKWLQTLVFYEGFEHTPVATKAFGTPVRRDSRSGAPSAARPYRKTRPKTGLRVAVTLVWSLGPGAPPEGARRGLGAPKGTQNTTYSVDSRKTIKNKPFENVHPSRVPGPFWPKRAPDRTPITT